MDRPCSRSTTRSSPATPTRCACCSRSSASRSSGSRWTSWRARRARRSSWRSNPNGRIPCAAARGRHARSGSRTRSSGTSPRARPSCRRAGSSARRCSSGCSSSSTATSRTSRWCAPGTTSGSPSRTARRSRRRWSAATTRSRVMEAHLASRTFFVAERYSIADIAPLRLHARGGRGRLRPRAVPRAARVARPRARAAALDPDHAGLDGRRARQWFQDRLIICGEENPP